MNAAILNIGTELLMGMTVNTNSAFLSEKLNELGISVLYHVVVGDNPERIREAIKTYLNKVDLVLTTGGLGPTLDDITKEVVAETLDLEMVYHEDVAEALKIRFAKMNRPMTDNNLRQAWFPESSVLMENTRGTAPGCITAKGEKAVLMFPGPPRELVPMFHLQAWPWLSKRSGSHITSLFLKTFGLGESALEDQLLDLIEHQTNPTLATYVKNSEVTLRLTAAGRDEEHNLQVIQPIADEVKKRIGDYIFAESNIGMEEVVVDLLRKKGKTLALAESCTGGMIAQMITSVPGSSAVLDRGIVTYSNRAKQEELGVRIETLEAHGAVSRETAVEMAMGILEKSKADYGVAVTGIAGPDGGSAEKPVGLVYIAVAFKENDVHVICREHRFTGDRERIRMSTAINALDTLRRIDLGQCRERLIEVVPWQSDWTSLYETEQPHLKEALAPVLINLHHIGSTSVEGLSSKPILDILVEVSSLEGVDLLNSKLEALGYVAYGEYGIEGRRFFTKDSGGKRTHHLHCFLQDSEGVRRHLAFRNYLAVHKDKCEAYAQLKLKLARVFRYDNLSYCAGKDAFVKAIEKEALAWLEDGKR